MGLGNVIQSAGSLVRAESEFNLLKIEDMKRVRSQNTIATARSKELDATTDEANRSARMSGDAFFSKETAREARNAAIAGLVSAVASGVSGVISAAGSGNALGVVGAVLKGTFGVLGAFFALLGAQDEFKMAETQFGILDDDAKADQKNVQALDGNPTR